MQNAFFSSPKRDTSYTRIGQYFIYRFDANDDKFCYLDQSYMCHLILRKVMKLRCVCRCRVKQSHVIRWYGVYIIKDGRVCCNNSLIKKDFSCFKMQSEYFVVWKQEIYRHNSTCNLISIHFFSYFVKIMHKYVVCSRFLFCVFTI